MRGAWVYSDRLGGAGTTEPGEMSMADEQDKPDIGERSSGSGAATPPPKKSRKPARKPPQPLPPWKVLLHNDDKNSFEYVIITICELTTLDEKQAVVRTKEAHDSGVALLLTTHKERAELYQEQFTSKGLNVTIEPAE